MMKLGFRSLLSLFAAVAAFAWPAVADTNNYIGTDQQWGVDGNWSLGRVPTADDDVTVDGKAVTCEQAVTVKSLTLTGTAAVTFRNAAKTPYVSVSDWRNSAIYIWDGRMKVTVSGKLSVGSGATLYSACESETGSIVAFTCGSLDVAEGGTISADRLGYQWVEHTADKAPDNTFSDNSGSKKFYTYAYGHGQGFGNAGGYGGAGMSGNVDYGKAYGYRAAPFMAGSPVGTYSGNLDHPSAGSVVLFVSGHAQVNGTITAAETGTKRGHGSNSGGGIWLCAGTLDLSSAASVCARGGTCGGAYRSAGGGGRIAIGLGLTASDIEALAQGNEPADLTYVDAYAASCNVLAGINNNGAGTPGNPGTALYVYRSSVVDIRGITASPAEVGTAVPAYGFHAFAKGQVPEFSVDSAVYPSEWRGAGRYGKTGREDTAGDSPLVTWTFGEEYLCRVLVRGTGSVTCGGSAHTADFDVWLPRGGTLALAADEGTSFSGWYGDFAGGFSTSASLSVGVRAPLLVQSVFADAVGTSRTYSGAAGGFWSEAANWTPSGVPTPMDDLTVPAGKTVRGLHALAARSLTVAGSLALGGTTPTATTAQKLTDVPAAFSGLYLTQDLTVSGTLSIGSSDQLAPVVAASVGGNLTLTGSGKLAVYANEHQAAVVAPYAGVYAARQVVAIGGNFTVEGKAVVYPVAESRTGTPVEWRVAGDFTLASGAQVNAENLGFNWSPKADARCLSAAIAILSGVKNYTMAPGHPNKAAAYDIGCHYGGGERAYGSAYAPFMPGTHSSSYNGQAPVAGGGSVFIRAAGEMTLAGTVNANGMRPSNYSGNSGGSIWLCAKKIVAESSAALTAIGGKNGHSTLGFTGSGGRIALGIGLSDADIEALAGGALPSEVQGVTAVDEITLVKNVDVKGGPENTKDPNGNVIYGFSGTAVTVSGAAADTIVTVVGTPVEPTGANGPVYDAVSCPQNQAATFTATETCSVSGETEVRYTVQGWTVTTTDGEPVSSGTGATATFTVGKNPLRLTWLWGARESRLGVAANDAEKGSVRFVGTGSDTVWTETATSVSAEAVAGEDSEFLYWVGDVPYGCARQNPLVLNGVVPRRVTAVFRTAEAAQTRTWKGPAYGAANWTDANQWTPANIPGPDDDVIVAQGTCDIGNFATAGSLSIRDTAIVRVAVTSVAGASRRDILDDYWMRPVEGPQIEEAGLVVARSLVLTNKAQLSVGTYSQERRSCLSVGGDLRLDGTNVLVVAGGRTDETYTFARGAGFVTVGGALVVGGKSLVRTFAERYTGGSVVFRADSIAVGPEATVAAWAGGFWYFGGRTPATEAPGVGYDYTTAGGYGGYGLRNGKGSLGNGFGQPYGQEYAPVHPGSCRGSWGTDAKYGGGLIRLHARRVRIEGRLDARPSENEKLACSGSGGGIWVTSAGRMEIGPTAVLTAKGGYRCVGTSYAGAGGRIALASRVTDAQVDELARTGLIASWGPDARRYRATEAFLAAHPGVTVDVSAGEPVSAYNNLEAELRNDALYTGTFRVIDGNQGFSLIVR